MGCETAPVATARQREYSLPVPQILLQPRNLSVRTVRGRVLQSGKFGNCVDLAWVRPNCVASSKPGGTRVVISARER